MTLVSREALQFLQNSSWMAALSSFEKSRVEHEVFEKNFIRGSQIFRKGESCNFWLGVAKGHLKSSNVFEDGNKINFMYIQEGNWTGEGSLINQEPRKYQLEANSDCLLVYLPLETFNWLKDTSIHFNHFLIMQLNARLGLFISMFEYGRIHEIGDRVARFLYSIFQPDLFSEIRLNSEMNLPIAQEDLAMHCGISRQKLNEVLKDMEKLEILEISYRSLKILDIKKLKAYKVSPAKPC